MGHNPPVLPQGTIPAHYVLTPGRFEALDQYASESLDGLAGGTYAPAEPIAIGGAGLALSGSCNILGGVSTGRDAVGVTLAASVFPTFNGSVRSRTITVPIRLLSEADDESLRTAEQSFDPYGVKSLRRTQASWFCAIPALRLHHGATLLSGKVRWRSGALPSSLGDLADAAKVPLARLVRVKSVGLESGDFAPSNIAELWKVPQRGNSASYALGQIVHSTGGGSWDGSNGYTYRCVQAGITAGSQPSMSTTIGDDVTDGGVVWRVEYGFVNPYFHYQFPPVAPDADIPTYHNDGLPQDIELRFNMNTTIDTVTYEYRLEIAEPGGEGVVSYGNIYHSLELTITDIASLREP